MFQPEDQDTQPPSALVDNSQVLRELMAVYQSSLLGDETEDERRAGFQSILDLMVDAAINMCVGVSEARHVQKPKWDKDVFMLNCLTHLTVGVSITSSKYSSIDRIPRPSCETTTLQITKLLF